MILKLEDRAPDFQLPLLASPSTGQGPAHWQLSRVLGQSSALLIFVKESCPTCQYALPLIDRIYQNYSASKVAVVSIAQEEEQVAKWMVREASLQMPVLLDKDPHPVSEQYGLSYVPTVFYVNRDRRIEQVIEGFAREELVEINEKVARVSGLSSIPFFRPEEGVPSFRPG